MKKTFLVCLLTSSISWAMQNKPGQEWAFIPESYPRPRDQGQRLMPIVPQASTSSSSSSSSSASARPAQPIIWPYLTQPATQSSSSSTRPIAQYVFYASPQVQDLPSTNAEAASQSSLTTTTHTQLQVRPQQVEQPRPTTQTTSATSTIQLPEPLEQLILPLRAEGQQLLRQVWATRLSPWQRERILQQLKVLYTKLKKETSYSNKDKYTILLKKLSILINGVLHPDREGFLTINLTNLHNPETLFEISEMGKDTHTLTLTQDQEPFLLELDVALLRERLPNLRALRLRNIPLNSHNLRTILRAFPDITSLSISGATLNSALLDVLIKSELARNLTELDISGTRIIPTTLENLKHKLKQLETLKR